jgi:hypothetical protein
MISENLGLFYKGLQLEPLFGIKILQLVSFLMRDFFKFELFLYFKFEIYF